MIFSDRSHIDQVNEALWRSRGAGASVMVGSGFSRNARNVQPSGRPIPLLKDIGNELFRSLHPGAPAEREPPPERVLRLAQEYEVAFGATALHDKLRRMISDRNYVPQEAHKRLLRLPWADVITTNWDTLLERACEAVPERAYAIIRTNTDIPWSARPRVIKLHGSLPDPPLILTEESYRTYPHDFAPLVNTVQQAMMETVVLLLGFSGNDPNFLYWSGWVRDNLGTTAPKIYLAGHLKLSRSERRMLEARYSVIPIDLAEHPRVGEWPEHLRHEFATDWILSTLERGKPYDQARWPKPPVNICGDAANPLIEPIEARASAVPIEEPVADPPRRASTAEALQRTNETLKIWRHNRECYPGWIVFPVHIRDSLRRAVELWSPFILRTFPEMQALERLDAIYEIGWRFEKCLTRMPHDLEKAAQAVIDAINCEERTIDGRRVDGVDWTHIRAAWRETALSLLTAARYRLDSDAFEDRFRAMYPYVDDDPNTRQRVHQERNLWILWSLDYDLLTEHLAKWRVDDADPIWMVRKSAVLRDIGETAAADRLVDRAIGRIRALPRSGGSVTGPSQESWALWSRWSLDRYENVQERWQHLAPLKCDPSRELDHLARSLEETDPSSDTSAPGFDLGTRDGRSFGWSTRRGLEAAYQSIRLTEVGGLPLSVENMNVTRSLLRRGAERLVTEDYPLAVRQILRIAGDDRDASLQRVLTRERVAFCPKDEAKFLCEAAGRLTRQAIVRIEKTTHGRNVPWLSRARVAMEAWSRLALRMSDDVLDGIFRSALDLHGSRVVVADFWLHDPIGSLLRRSWEAMSERQRTSWILELLETPLKKWDEIELVRGYPDLGLLMLDAEEPPERVAENESRWTHVVNTLVDAMSGHDDERQLAATRIGAIAGWGVLKESETSKVAEALWDADAKDNNTLPSRTGLYDRAFIVLPEPRGGLGRRAFGRKWLMGDIAEVRLTKVYGPEGAGFPVTHDDPRKADDILYQTGCTIDFLRTHGRTLDLSSAEEAYLLAVAEKWTTTNLRWAKAIPDFVRYPFRESLRGAVYGLSCLLSDVVAPRSLGKKLHQRVAELHDNDVPAYGILPGVLKSAPELSDDISLLMSSALVSDDAGAARSAVRSLHRWLIWATDPALSLPHPPRHLVRELALAISTRRQTVISSALGVATWIVEHDNGELSEGIHDLVLNGLEYLLKELRYDRASEDSDLDIPLTRWRCIELARALARREPSIPRAVQQWLEIGRDDPLPEVRRVAESWYREARITG